MWNICGSVNGKALKCEGAFRIRIFDIREEWRQLHRNCSSAGSSVELLNLTDHSKVVGSIPTSSEPPALSSYKENKGGIYESYHRTMIFCHRPYSVSPLFPPRRHLGSFAPSVSYSKKKLVIYLTKMNKRLRNEVGEQGEYVRKLSK